MYIPLLDKIGPWVFINTRNQSFIDSFYAYFGIHDLILLVIGIALFRQIQKANNGRLRIAEVILYVLLFTFIFPDFAAAFEAQRVLHFEEVNGDLIEGFNLLYVWGRFPTYWLFAILIPVIPKLKNLALKGFK